MLQMNIHGHEPKTEARADVSGGTVWVEGRDASQKAVIFLTKEQAQQALGVLANYLKQDCPLAKKAEDCNCPLVSKDRPA